jgi:hypothetical protein
MLVVRFYFTRTKVFDARNCSVMREHHSQEEVK